MLELLLISFGDPMAKVTYIDDRSFHKKAASGELDSDANYLLRKQFACQEIKIVETEDRTLDFVISTEAIDRMNDRIMVEGWDLEPFKSNPVVLFGHDGNSPPVAKALSIGAADGNLIARAQFTSKDLYPFGDMIYRMYLEGFMRATSVGFVPKEFDFSDEEERSGGFDFTRQELLEFSAVPVPANPEALIQARSMGIDTLPLKTWAEEVLDNWDEHKDMPVGRKAIEQLRKKADPKATLTWKVPSSLQDQLLSANLDRVKNFTSIEFQPDPVILGSPGIDLRSFNDLPDSVTKENIMSDPEQETKAEDDTETKSEDVLKDEVEEKEIETASVEEETDKSLEDSNENTEQIDGDLPEHEESRSSETFEGLLAHLLSVADDCFQLLEDSEILEEKRKSRVGRRQISTTAGALLELGNLLLDTQEKNAGPAPETEGDAVKQVVDNLFKASPSETDDDLLDMDADELKEMVTSILPEIIQQTVEQEMKNIRGKID